MLLCVESEDLLFLRIGHSSLLAEGSSSEFSVVGRIERLRGEASMVEEEGTGSAKVLPAFTVADVPRAASANESAVLLPVMRSTARLP